MIDCVFTSNALDERCLIGGNVGATVPFLFDGKLVKYVSAGSLYVKICPDLPTDADCSHDASLTYPSIGLSQIHHQLILSPRSWLRPAPGGDAGDIFPRLIHTERDGT